ncbi:hypothetical protein KXW51_000820 [Aspergillus fumigatus]|nr:hypothetical protein KXW85_002128 [Aspergillus fumigatus]KAH2056669.1 hypothetical protein KXW51_000820 [Aspergillus fumigatus]KAH2217521.1 hypothetical protein KXW71_002157 [Aspergillus fumigatus]
MSLVRAFLLLQHQYSSVYFELSGFIYYRCFVSNPFHKTFSVLPPTLCLLCINCSTGRQSRTESEGRRGREGVDDQYLLSGSRASKIDPEEDTVFEAEPEQGTTSGAGEAKVVMDEPSLELLSGSTVDYTMELIGSQFKIVDNPRATSNCGCGTSFDVKD